MLSNKYENKKLLPAALDVLSFDAIAGANVSEEAVESDLKLPTELALSVVDGAARLSWESSVPDVISADGQVTCAEHGTIVRLIAHAAYKGYTAEKEFLLFVPGTTQREDTVFVLTEDLNPYTGKAVTGGDRPVFFDQDYTSLVLDLGTKTAVTDAELHYDGGVSRVNKDALSLYAADENGIFRKITGWDLLKTENTYYFYNFSTEARYIKIHCHLENRDKDASFCGSLQDMITAGAEDDLLRAHGAFENEVPIILQNTSDEAVHDAVFAFTLDDLNIDRRQVQEDLSDLRFVVDGRQLPIYVDDGIIYIKVAEMESNAQLLCTVYFGNAEAERISDGEAVFENLYGTKTIQSIFTENSFTNIPGTAKLPDGSVISVAINRSGGLSKRISRDGGRTWTNPELIEETVGVINEAGGFLVDGDTIFMFGHKGLGFDATDINNSDMRIYVLKSTDGGETWSAPIETNVNRNYLLMCDKEVIEV